MPSLTAAILRNWLLALSSIGSGVITAFVALLFASKDWGNASFAFTAFGLGEQISADAQSTWTIEQTYMT